MYPARPPVRGMSCPLPMRHHGDEAAVSRAQASRDEGRTPAGNRQAAETPAGGAGSPCGQRATGCGWCGAINGKASCRGCGSCRCCPARRPKTSLPTDTVRRPAPRRAAVCSPCGTHHEYRLPGPRNPSLARPGSKPALCGGHDARPLVSGQALPALPLTGLTRKVLRRSGSGRSDWRRRTPWQSGKPAGVAGRRITLPQLEGASSLSQALERGPVLLAFFKISCPVVVNTPFLSGASAPGLPGPERHGAWDLAEPASGTNSGSGKITNSLFP